MLREVPGGFRGRFVRISEEFSSNARRPRRSQLKPPGAGRVAAAQGHKRSYGLAVSILGRLSPLSPCCCSLSCRSCSCCSCCSFCPRLACNACTPSSLTRFPFHDSQVSCWSYKSLQERPKRRPRGRKRRQETAQRRQDSAKRRQMSTKRCQDAPRSDFGAIWARFWTSRGGKNH